MLKCMYLKQQEEHIKGFITQQIYYFSSMIVFLFCVTIVLQQRKLRKRCIMQVKMYATSTKARTASMHYWAIDYIVRYFKKRLCGNKNAFI